jgi:hypothetical protein
MMDIADSCWRCGGEALPADIYCATCTDETREQRDWRLRAHGMTAIAEKEMAHGTV